jgi:uncharacterized repeat protein (TIGR01451 family)
LGQLLPGQVALSAAGAPAGATVAFGTNPLASPATTTMTVGNLGAVAPGSYTMTVIGSGSATYATRVDLDISAGAPGMATPLAPAAGATDQPLRPSFSWSAVANQLDYTFELATDPAFTQLVYTATLRANSLDLAQGLRSGGHYYWRMRSSNGCGQDATPQVASFSVRTTPRVLLVDDDSNNPDVRPAYTAALGALGVAYDVWDTANSDGEPDAGTLANYSTVIWFGGQDGSPGPDGEAALASYLEGAGCLFVSAQEYHYYRGRTPFMQSYLGVAAATNDVVHTQVTGAEWVFGGLGPYTLAVPYVGDYSDVLVPGAGAALAFAGDKGDAAVYKDAGRYRTTFWGFGLESLPNATARQDAMSRVVEWCRFQNDLVVEQTVEPAGVLRPGQPITYTLTFGNIGEETASGVVLTDTLAPALTGLSVSSSGVAAPPAAGADYVWQVAALAPGASGTITITGRVAATLTSDTSIQARGAIHGGGFDTDAANNRAVVASSVVVPRVGFAAATYSAGEGEGAATIAVALDAPNPHASVTVQYMVGGDYPAQSGTLTIPAGTSSATLGVPIADDAVASGTKTATLTLSGPSGAALGARSQATLAIADDDGDGLAPRVYLPVIRR